jgi:hypothetical protein
LIEIIEKFRVFALIFRVERIDAYTVAWAARMAIF